MLPLCLFPVPGQLLTPLGLEQLLHHPGKCPLSLGSTRAGPIRCSSSLLDPREDFCMERVVRHWKVQSPPLEVSRERLSSVLRAGDTEGTSHRLDSMAF